jgi:hypothetical protein
MAERFKAVDCKSTEFSHRRFESYFLLFYSLLFVKIRSMAQLVARLFWEQEVMCSNHIISINYFFLLVNSSFLDVYRTIYIN